MLVASAVVWYKPSIEYIDYINILSVCTGHVWVIDNSPVSHSHWIPSGSNFTYVWLGTNRGIAHALNVGCRAANDAGYDYILTMDQDSSFDSTELSQHIKESMVAFRLKAVAIVSTNAELYVSEKIEKFIECESAITSGNLLRLSAWYEVGGFVDKLFIDQVDHDLCYRFKRRGYRILSNLGIAMNHQVGNPMQKIIMGYRIQTTNHNWIRRYYQVRNSLYLRQQYPEYAKPLRLYIRDLRDQIIGIILLEKDVARKMRAMMLGAWDFFKNRYGSWDDIRPNKH